MPRTLCAAAALIALAAGLVRCTDSTTIGGDLLDGNQLPVLVTDSVPVRLTTERARASFATEISLAQLSVPVGCYDDPLLGATRATVGFELVERTRAVVPFSVTFDSVVLVLPLSTAAFADTLATVGLRVTGAAPGTLERGSLRTDEPIETTGVEYGAFAGVLPRGDQLETVFVDTTLRVDTVGPQLRIPLNQAFVDDINDALTVVALRDTFPAANDSVLTSLFPGLVIEPTACSGTLARLLGAGDAAQRLGVNFYYRTADDSLAQFALSPLRGGGAVGELRVHYEHDYAGTLAERLLADPAPEDSLSAVQSLDGLLTRVDFPDVSLLEGAVVNFAQLEIPVLEDGVVDPLPRILPRRANSAGDLVNLNAEGVSAGTEFTVEQGGTIARVLPAGGGPADSIDVYRLNVTSYMQGVANGVNPPELFLVAIAQSQFPGRSLLAAGPGSGTAPRLLLALTELP